ncbi:MAG TPA: efflux RND transporter periplasmic adaptor subunit [Planctomycetes bacterium]|nr:efflux RND transporter periplasmic adaptor subunit [Planctomycetota bacterium]
MRESRPVPDLDRLRIDKSRVPAARTGRRKWIWGLLVIALAGTVYYHRDRLPWGRRAGAEAQAWPTARVEAFGTLKAVTTGIAANGYVVARRRAALSTVLSGRLVQMNVEEGDHVKAGDVVARIQFDDYEARVRQASRAIDLTQASRKEAVAGLELERRNLSERMANLAASRLRRKAAEVQAAEAEREKVRQRKSFEQGVISESEWDSVKTQADRLKAVAEAAAADELSASRAVDTVKAGIMAREAAVQRIDEDLRRLQAMADQAAIDLEKTYVRAPFAGVIVDKGAEEGEVVAALGASGNSKGAVATLVDVATLEVQVELPEPRLEGLAEGQGAEIFLDVAPQKGWPGRIRQIWPRADRQKGTVEIRIVFLERPPELREEMGLRVVFTGEMGADGATEPSGLRLPSEALVRRGDRTLVAVVRRGIVAMVEVEVLEEKDGRVVVEGALRAGERVLLDPPAHLRDGDDLPVKEGGRDE